MLYAPLVAVPAIVAGPAADLAPPTAVQLDAVVRRCSGPSAEDRRSAASTIAALPPSGTAEYARRLTRPRSITAETFRRMVLETWAQVPNTRPDGPLYMTKPEPPWHPPKVARGKPRPRRPPPHDPEKVDWLDALAALDIEQGPLAALPDRVAARGEALEAVALMRALGASGRAEAFDSVFDFAFALEGVFRDECGRAIRSLGAKAVPGLIHRMYEKGRPLFKQRRYASYQLDRMDRARPQKAVSSAPDDRLRAEILHAYGEARALDAIDAVLGEVDAPSRRVKREARWAWLRYVTGPPPPPAPKRKRKLPGGVTESEEKEDYLNFRELAVIALDQHVAEVLDRDPAAADGPLGRAAAQKPGEAKLTEALFAYYDARHEAEWATLYAGAVEKRRRGDLPGAVADYSSILAHDPTYGRRGEMAEAFQAFGVALLPGDREAGARWLREAMALDPARAPHDQALLAFLDGERSIAEGRADSAAFRDVLGFEPDHAGARAALARVTSEKRRRRWSEFAVAGATALLLTLMLIFGGRRGAGRSRAGG